MPGERFFDALFEHWHGKVLTDLCWAALHDQRNKDDWQEAIRLGILTFEDIHKRLPSVAEIALSDLPDQHKQYADIVVCEIQSLGGIYREIVKPSSDHAGGYRDNAKRAIERPTKKYYTSFNLTRADVCFGSVGVLGAAALGLAGHVTAGVLLVACLFAFWFFRPRRAS
jgi:hypothetical protein